MTLGGETHRLQVRDVGGFVDLNTAQPYLLDQYLSEIGLTSAEIEQFRTWRQTSKRLLRIEDLIRVTDAQDADRSLLLATATVYSGRRGVAMDQAPEALKDILDPLWNEAWATAPSGANFAVMRTDGLGALRLGVIHIRPEGDGKIILAR